MSIHALSLSPHLPNYTIEQKREERQAGRRKWNEDFSVNLESVAAKVAETITADVFAKYQSALGDCFLAELTPDQTLRLTYSFDLLRKNDAKELKERAKESAELAPYKQWFDHFTADHDQARQAIEENVSSMQIKSVSRQQPDSKYFAVKMDVLASAVQKKVDAVLKEFAKQAGNQQFKAEVLGPYVESNRGSWHTFRASKISSDPVEQKVVVKLGLRA